MLALATFMMAVANLIAIPVEALGLLISMKYDYEKFSKFFRITLCTSVTIVILSLIVLII